MRRAILIYAAIYIATIALCLTLSRHITGPLGAVLVGILMGVVSAVPTSVLMVALLRRPRGDR